MSDRAEQAHHIRATDQWPHGDILPVKRHTSAGGWPDFGCIILERPLTVFEVPYLEMAKQLNPDLDQIPQTKFDSIDALLDAGWVAD